MAETDEGRGGTELDRRLMGVALRLGRRNMGRTFPNPAVGALIVRFDGAAPRIVGRGWTGAGGRPHGEAVALQEAGEAARGATAYVSLEPCSHAGRGAPCAEALVGAGVARVITPMEDPDPRVVGTGHKVLREAGIEVVTGVLAEEAALVHRGHVLRVTAGRPMVTLKLAVSADGMIGKREGGRMIITGRAAFDRVQAIRAESDAVLIGIGTVLVDNPRLTVRHPGLEGRSPIRVILDRAARLPVDSNLATTAREVPVWLVVGPEAPGERRDALAKAGVEIIEAKEGPGGIDLQAALAVLAERGITRVLVEGGSHVASSIVSTGCADEIVLFRASVVVGPDGVRAFAGHALSAVERSPRYRLIEEARVGDDHMRRYLRTG
jgi:diaminohydroxyphosphoribosylaminopyrimidine deaminase/5-amino-6-(5-phosphoribosylamino)uracil reductase